MIRTTISWELEVLLVLDFFQTSSYSYALKNLASEEAEQLALRVFLGPSQET